jgi:hypothetical protein
MKNIHILPTDKPSRLSILNSGKLNLGAEIISSSNSRPQNIFFTSDEEIKEGDWVIENHTFKREPYIGKCFYPKNDGTVTDEVLKRDLLSVNYEGHYETLARKHNCKKIILTTDQDLIKDGVQSIDDTFLEWFVKNPSCEEVEVEPDYDEIRGDYYRIVILQEETKSNCPKCRTTDFDNCHSIQCPMRKKEPKQKTIEEAADLWATDTKNVHPADSFIAKKSFIQGDKSQQEQDKNKYSEEDMINFADFKTGNLMKHVDKTGFYLGTNKVLDIWKEQFKKK